MGGARIVQALQDAQQGFLRPVKQPEEGVTYAHKIEKAEAAVDWRLSATEIDRRVRAFNPFPGATAQMVDEVIKLWGAYVETHATVQVDATQATQLHPSHQAAPSLPGTVLSANEHGVRVQCGEGVLCITELQRAGGKRLMAADFLRGFVIVAGQVFKAD
jgi:methionyl-tRNA formyltransferase